MRCFRLLFSIFFFAIAFNAKNALAERTGTIVRFNQKNGVILLTVKDDISNANIDIIGCASTTCLVNRGEKTIKGTSISPYLSASDLEIGKAITLKSRPFKTPILEDGIIFNSRLTHITSSDKVIGKVVNCSEKVKRNSDRKLTFKVLEDYTNVEKTKIIRFTEKNRTFTKYSCKELLENTVLVPTRRRCLRGHSGIGGKVILLSDNSQTTSRAIPVPRPTSTSVPRPTSTPVPRPTSTPVPRPTSTPELSEGGMMGMNMQQMQNMPPVKEPVGGFPIGNVKSSVAEISNFSGDPGLRFYNQGVVRTHCRISHFSYDDPIVYPGSKNATHLHMFFGNTKADAFSTIESIRDQGESTCDGGILNRSSYWIPAMLDNDGVPLGAFNINVYYKSIFKTQARKTIPIPDGLQMVAGDAMANQETGYISEEDINLRSYFYCVSESSGNTYNDKSNSIREANCKAGDILVFSIGFPQCWDGLRKNSSDQSHMEYLTIDNEQQYPCPTSHPHRIPDIRENIWYRVPPGGVYNWHLSSDMYDWQTHGGGFSRHADLFEGWNSDIKRRITENCLNESIDCGDNYFNDSQIMNSLDNYAQSQFNKSPYIQ